MRAEKIENTARFRTHELAVEHPETGYLAAEKKALGNREMLG